MKIIKENHLKENSLSKLDKPELIDKIVDFIRENPFPVDEDFHKFAMSNNLEPDNMEEYAYAILSVFLCGGKSKGKPVSASKENLDIGSKIEQEHVSYDTTDTVVKHIQEIISKKIEFDHLSENDNYYIDGVDFKKELQVEK